jgi:hypothetical protein
VCRRPTGIGCTAHGAKRQIRSGQLLPDERQYSAEHLGPIGRTNEPISGTTSGQLGRGQFAAIDGNAEIRRIKRLNCAHANLPW